MPRQEMIPVNALSGSPLAVSEGHRPAHSRSAIPTREYEPGSGDSHDHAPARRSHPPRSPPADHWCRGEPANHTGPPLQPQDLASPAAARRPCGPVLTLEPLRPLGQGMRAGQGLPRTLAGSPLTSRASSPGDHTPRDKTRRPPHRRQRSGEPGHNGIIRGRRPLGEVQKLDRPFHMSIHPIHAG